MALVQPTQPATFHYSRGWTGDPFAPVCGCELAPCGLVDSTRLNPECDQHAPTRTMRAMHFADRCPGAGA